MDQSQRVKTLDGLRGVAASVVVVVREFIPASVIGVAAFYVVGVQPRIGRAWGGRALKRTATIAS